LGVFEYELHRARSRHPGRHRRPLGQLLQERIFGPLGLGATSFPTETSVEPGFAHGYASIEGSPLIDVTPILSPTLAWAAGAIVSNAADVSKFYSVLLRRRLLPAAQLAEMKRVTGEASSYGLGLTVTHTPCGKAFGHAGLFPGWQNFAWATAKGRRVGVAMVNVDYSRLSFRLDQAAETALCSG
jgi:D-alanyl-D-alanine carboxypeptidase